VALGGHAALGGLPSILFKWTLPPLVLQLIR
jgi:hypothetical protein